MKIYYNGLSNSPYYSVCENLAYLKINEHHVLINPEIGGWANVTEEELGYLYIHKKQLPFELGQKAYYSGLAKRNNACVFNPEGVQFYPGVLYFFEFDLSSSCNLNCIYCSDATTPTKIEKGKVSVGKLWIDRVFEYAKKYFLAKVTLEFTGGEPLVNSDLIREICSYAYRKFKEINLLPKFILSTNLTILGCKEIQLLKEFDIKIQVSLDGPKDIHDLHRPFVNGKGSFDTVISNIKILKKENINVSSIASVITAYTVDRMSEIAKFIINLDYKQMTLQPMQPIGRGKEMIDLLPAPKSYVDNLIKTLETVYIPYWNKFKTYLHVRHFGILFSYLLEPWRSYMCQRSPCGNARNIIATKANGDVYGCNQAPFNEETILGNIHDMSFEECTETNNAIKFQERSIDKIDECKVCIFRSFCQGACPKSALSLHGNIYAPGDTCELNKLLFTKGIEMILDNKIPEELLREFSISYGRKREKKRRYV